MPAGLLDTLQCQELDMESQDWPVAQEGGPDSHPVYSSALYPTPEHGVYPLVMSYLAQVLGCSQKHMGDIHAHLPTTKKQRKKEA